MTSENENLSDGNHFNNYRNWRTVRRSVHTSNRMAPERPFTVSPNLGLILVFLSAPVSTTSLQRTKENESEKKTLKRKRDEEEERSQTKVCKEGFQLFHHHVFSFFIGEYIRQYGVQR